MAGTAPTRSAAQQVNHWARIGREPETSKSVSQHDVAQVLSGRASYDRDYRVARRWGMIAART